jgi:hypothetical protein
MSERTSEWRIWDRELAEEGILGPSWAEWKRHYYSTRGGPEYLPQAALTPQAGKGVQGGT